MIILNIRQIYNKNSTILLIFFLKIWVTFKTQIDRSIKAQSDPSKNSRTSSSSLSLFFVSIVQHQINTWKKGVRAMTRTRS